MLQTPEIKPTLEHAKRILELCSYGLVRGTGKPEPGKMCVEAAVNYAFGLPHGDKPPCVGAEVCRFKIGLNDKLWSSPQARATGMQALAIAQLGSNQLDQEEFHDLLWFRFGTEIQPWIWRFLATKGDKDCRLAFATRMEMSKSLEECKAHAHAHGYDYSYSYSYGYDYSYDYSYSYGYDAWLSRVAKVGVDVLKELNSPGCEWLYLIKEKAEVKPPALPHANRG